MIPDTFYHIIDREPQLKTCCAKPMEDKGLQVTNEDVMNYFGDLCSNISGVPAHFVMNMDEIGHQAFADARETVCFVPTAHQKSVVRYPISRTGKRVTLIAYIFADGSFLRPGLVITRERFDDDFLTGCREWEGPVGSDSHKCDLWESEPIQSVTLDMMCIVFLIGQ
jgi:hypothetical protein